MKTTKQTIVEFKFPVTEEVLQSAALQLQRPQSGEPYYSFIYVSDDPSPKAAVKRAREYLNRFFGASADVIVQNIDTAEDKTPDSTKTTQTVERRVYSSEDNV